MRCGSDDSDAVLLYSFVVQLTTSLLVKPVFAVLSDTMMSTFTVLQTQRLFSSQAISLQSVTKASCLLVATVWSFLPPLVPSSSTIACISCLRPCWSWRSSSLFGHRNTLILRDPSLTTFFPFLATSWRLVETVILQPGTWSWMWRRYSSFSTLWICFLAMRLMALTLPK